MTTYYLSPDGSDSKDGLSEANAWATFAHACSTDFGAGDTLILLDGTYTESFDPNFSGTAGNPVTVRAQNDGAAIIDGGGVRIPVELMDSSYWVFEGIHAHNGAEYCFHMYNSTGCVFRRCSAHDAGLDGNNFVFYAHNSSGSLWEDCAAWGQGRVMMCVHGSAGNASDVTVRRCWANWQRWDGRTWHDDWPWGENLDNYNANGTIWENCISWGWHPATLTPENNTGDSSVCMYGFDIQCNDPSDSADNVSVLGCMSVFSNVDHEPTDPTNTSLMASTEWGDTRPAVGGGGGSGVRPINDQDDYKVGLVILGAGSTDNLTIRDFFAAYNGSHGIALPLPTSNYYPTLTGMTLDHITLKNNTRQDFATVPAGGAGTDILQSVLDKIDNDGNTPTNLQIDRIWAGDSASSRSDSEGARLTKRYVDGVLTDTDLWPWPMEARILAETGISVTTEMQAILGLSGIVLSAAQSSEQIHLSWTAP